MVESIVAEESPRKRRVQFEFDIRALAKLDQVVESTDATTRAEVIRRALSLYVQYVDSAQRGATLCLEEPDGTLKRFLPLW
jgi:metal-responsive CopG/Arc/MetJ family transcriptional regulator